MMPINESSIGLIADEAAKAIFKTKRMPKYKNKNDRIPVNRKTIYVKFDSESWKNIVGSRGDGV